MVESSPRLILPRGLIFLASVWLIGSWIIAGGITHPIQPSASSYTPTVRMMLICMTIGAVIGWPLLRLSQSPPVLPVRQSLIDLVVLIGLGQVVIWPLRLVTMWTPLRTAALDLSIVGWMTLTGAVIASVVGSSRAGPRCLAMVVCLAITLLGPAAAWLGSYLGMEASMLPAFSPVMAVLHFGEASPSNPQIDVWINTAVVMTAATSAWIALLVANLFVRSASAERI